MIDRTAIFLPDAGDDLDAYIKRVAYHIPFELIGVHLSDDTSRFALLNTVERLLRGVVRRAREAADAE